MTIISMLINHDDSTEFKKKNRSRINIHFSGENVYSCQSLQYKNNKTVDVLHSEFLA